MEISEFLYTYVKSHGRISDEDVIKITTSCTKQWANESATTIYYPSIFFWVDTGLLG
jgi:hypothetical protein